MLTLTEQAVTGIHDLIDRPEVPRSGGLRIANESGTLTISVAQTPADDDTILDTSGARLFLDAEAAQILDEQTLDMASDAEGRVQFSLVPQQA
jgi:iron-sulfur cluster assembly protein